MILAAGKGTRLKSPLPKALHTICGRPMLEFLVKRAEEAGCSPIVVVAGYKREQVKKFLGDRCETVAQTRQLGSGHAVAQAASKLKRFDGSVLVMYCDTPLIRTSSVAGLVENYRRSGSVANLLTATLDDPTGYGRVVRGGDGSVKAIIEQRDADEAQRAVREVNVGCYVFDSKKLFEALKWVPRNPGKNEYYLTDAISLLARDGRVEAVPAAEVSEMLGVNTRSDLAELEGIMQERLLKEWAERGVRIRDPRTTVIDADVRIGQDTVIQPNTVIEQGSVIGKGCTVGPFARIRGASRIGDGAVIGNFVEIVRSTVGPGSQVKHLSYLGDAVLGKRVNVGAGTITANFDGKKKHKTVIRDGAQIGSGTVLVAPVTIGRGAKTGAGAVVTRGKNVPDRAVVIGVPAKLLGKGRK